MALFTDAPPSSIDDLVAQDTQLLSVLQVEGIDVTQKLALAWDELGLELSTMLNTFGAENRLFWQPPRTNLNTVVVTPSLKLWHTFRSLEMVYEDACNNQLNNRYAGKRTFFHQRAVWAWQKLAAIGVGMTATPVAKAAIPSVSAVPVMGAPLADGMYYVTSAWVNQSGEEGAAADAASVSTVTGSFEVQPGPAPQNATGWNIYAGTDPNGMTMQNGAVLAAGQTWVQPVPLAVGGRGPGSGQAPSYLKVVPPVIQRG